jgi:hypothetical protein
VVNHKRGATSQEKSLLNSGTSLFIPQRNVGIKDKGINTPPPPVHSKWMTLRRFKRDLLRGHPFDYSSLTGGSRASVIDIKIVKVKP